MGLVNKMLAGDRRALAQLLTIIENEKPESSHIMHMVQQNQTNGYYIGVTGSPGSGKSTLVDKIILQIRSLGLKAGVIAVDPSSPFSGGAILGDRIRMQNHALDSGVFIRSLATRGSLGGLSRAAKNSARILNASGKDYCIIETVGVGQIEIDIVDSADTTIVVLMPEAGDSVQAIKAGILEIADIIVVNKADIKGSDRLIADLQVMLQENQRHSWWQIPVLATQATKDIGVKELFEKIEEHRRVLGETGHLQTRRQEQRVTEFMEIIEQKIKDFFKECKKEDTYLKKITEKVKAGELDPYSAAIEALGSNDLFQNLLMKMRGEFKKEGVKHA
ncbi:MAG TPA: methylmalonyl Co-A mutase-associated GTPase MeaB [Deltaproteobacteria bacterium]|nr:methylmalonyl Co-A mutase-associated GTPase MeaB [Deltaproteobacteria bacterium]